MTKFLSVSVLWLNRQPTTSPLSSATYAPSTDKPLRLGAYVRIVQTLRDWL
jgi:hypothetical protein